MSMDTSFFDDDVLLVRLAREVAIDHWELDEILKRYNVSAQQWEKIKADKYFNSVLTAEIIAWNETNNTHERSKLKAAAVIEEWLPEANFLLRARGESLAAKVGLAQLLTKIAGMGLQSAIVEGGAGGEKFVININLGKDKEVRIEKVINEVDNSDLGIIDEEPVQRAIPVRGPMSAHVQSGGGVKIESDFDKILNPVELIKKW